MRIEKYNDKQVVLHNNRILREVVIAISIVL